jgi:biopolymer transport protein ExbB/TolQ
MFDDNLLALLMKGGFTILVLLICSILSLKVVIEKLIQFNGIKAKYIDDLLEKVLNLLEKNPKDAAYACKTYRVNSFFFKITTPMSSVFKYVIDNSHLTKEELLESAFNKLDQEISKLESGLGVLASLGAVSPFIGLFGTVVGIIKSFTALSLTDTSNYTHVMSGISEALIATAAGLFVAVPAVLFYNYFAKKLRLSMPTFDEAIHSIVRAVKNSNR